ncbi:protein-glutamate methylesterase/protein-glutamine glutaminase [Thermobrachium celere]|uniref:protein-glutamate methylesterase/protein-glutamine glutaminase n=1 Tax=Thermobrachium celere TaxID=53422 RepID=UPI0019403DEA|nr:chemotaxis response regulator protein-glutamate methylesterase [Thermobrachium celere]GFR36124.1 chemotaxis response regulator protein-glutamate methylesterase [Thermobrachium celere]
MFDKIKVLVVDDSAFMRKMISDIINSQKDMYVIDTAKDGFEAIEKANKLNPDIITLDVEMPRKNGLEALVELKKVSKAEVIMLSSLTSEGSTITIEALRLGAFDFIQKPSGSISLDINKVKDEITEKIRYAYAYKNKLKTNNKVISNFVSNKSKVNSFNNNFNALLLGASTGGPKVLFDLITKLPNNIDIPILVVQHMPTGFTKAFADRMNKSSNLRVVEAEDNQKIENNVVYIAPGGYHMTVVNGVIKLDLSPQIHGVRPAVDKLFISAANYYKSGVIASIFTGMGKDGAEGVKEVKKNGGHVIAQDESTSVVFGMPKAAIQTGCVDIILPEDEILNYILKLLKRA